jgi:hypothetical protein
MKRCRASQIDPPYVVSPTQVSRAGDNFKQRYGRWNERITPAIPCLRCHGMQETS